MNRRRGLLALLCLVPFASLARAQAPERMRRVGWLTGGSPQSHAKLLAAFRDGLKERGWIEGRNVTLALRWAEGNLDRLPALAAELVRLQPDVIVTAANVVHLSVRKETSTIPIVMATGADPVEAGLAVSLARPGGNVTGLSGFYESIPIKMLELALEVVARGARISVLLDANYTTAVFRKHLREEFERRSRSAGVRTEFLEAATPEEVSRKLGALGRSRPAALIVLPGSMIFALGLRLVQSAEALKLPVIYPFEEMVDAGGLMSYSVNLPDTYRRAAHFVDRILRGAKPGELPIEQPTRLSLVVNLKTARALGVTIPQSVLVRADRIVE